MEDTRKHELLEEFFHAAERNDLASMQKYLNMGVKVNDKIHDHSILHIAANNGDAKFIEICLQKLKGIDIENRGDIFNLTPLHIGAQSEQYAVCQVLLKYGADVNALDNNGQSCLHFAVRVNNIRLALLFIRERAIVNICDVYNQTPLSLAIVDMRNYKMAKMLLDHEADTNFPRPLSPPLLTEAVINAPHRNYIPFLDLLVQYGADPNEIDRVGRTPLHYAAIKGNVELVSYFENLGCNMYVKDVTGKAILDLAKQHEHKELIMYLNRMRQLKAVQSRNMTLDKMRVKRI